MDDIENTDDMDDMDDENDTDDADDIDEMNFMAEADVMDDAAHAYKRMMYMI
jgi:hypothetical protein